MADPQATIDRIAGKDVSEWLIVPDVLDIIIGLCRNCLFSQSRDYCILPRL